MENLSQSQFGPFLIDVQERVLRRDGEAVPLTPKAFDVLAALVAQPGRLVSKQELLDKVWPDTFVEESNLTYNVFALRKALGDAADNGQYIETVPKRGYRFAAALTPVNARAGGQPLARDQLRRHDVRNTVWCAAVRRRNRHRRPSRDSTRPAAAAHGSPA